MAAAAQPTPAQLPLPGGRDGATVRLHPLLTATSIAPPAYIHREDGRLAALRALGVGVPTSEYLRIPLTAFLVEHPSAGPILIDTGLHPSCAVDPKQNLGRIGARAFSPRMEANQAASAQLRERGTEPEDVGLVVLTHMHIDHASAISEFPRATFVLAASEWRAATQPRGWRHGYRRQQFDHAFDYRTLDFERRGVDSYATFGRAFDLLGDGSLRLVYTPGHTLGHLSVVARLREREALIVGDAVYTMHALETGVLPWRVEDEHLYRRSLRELQIYVQSNPGALVIPTHDEGVWKSLEPVYE